MGQTILDSKPVKLVYGIVFPILTITLWLVLASINTDSRIKLLGSTLSDFVIRLLISTWFCTLYIRLSRFPDYRTYPNRKWVKADVGEVEKYFLVGLIVFFSTICGLVTYWAVRWFLPHNSNLASWMAIINSGIIFIPMVTRYWILKL